MLPSTFAAKQLWKRSPGDGAGCQSILKPLGGTFGRLFRGWSGQMVGKFEKTHGFTRWESAPIVPRP